MPQSSAHPQAPALRGRRREQPGPLARLDRIPVWPYERKLLWVVGAGYFFAFFDIVTISFAAPVIADQFHVSKSTVTLSITSSLIGYIIGAFADATIADKWGRRLSLVLSVGVFSLGTALAAASTNVTELIIFRFIAGLGIGAEIAAVTTYIGGLSPARPDDDQAGCPVRRNLVRLLHRELRLADTRADAVRRQGLQPRGQHDLPDRLGPWISRRGVHHDAVQRPPRAQVRGSRGGRGV